VLSFPPPDAVRSLREVTRADDYFMRVSEVVRQMGAARDAVQAVELLEQATHRMGADASVFASVIRDDDSRASCRFLLACEPEWFIEYEQRASYANDPWLAYATHHSEPIRGHEIAGHAASARSIAQLTQGLGFRSSVIVPAPSAVGLSRVGVLFLGSSTPGYFDDDGYVALKVVVRSVAMELHEWWIARIRDELIARTHISDSDLVLLAHERQGHSTKAIARALDASAGSIDSHFQRINAKLGVANRKAAARLAAEYGLI
jgi:DNA-binding CsgD family transcriptional regulator